MNLKFSQLCLGTMTFGSPVGQNDAIRLVHHALDAGINFIDTANMYEGYARVIGSPGGVAETILAKALKGCRDKVILATKVGMKVGTAPAAEYTSAAAIRQQLDRSLQRLATDRIELYYLHRPDPVTPLLEIVTALAEAIHAGKILHYGVSNYSAAQLTELLAVADAHHLPRPIAIQPPLSVLRPEATVDLLPVCQTEKIAVIPYQVLQGGLLTGKYRRGHELPADSRLTEKADWMWPLGDALFDRLEAVERQAQAAGQTMTQFAIRWAAQQPAVASVIIGVKRVDQIDEALAAFNTD